MGRDTHERHVVVVGAGFGGLAAVRRLSQRGARERVRVTLVDRNGHHTFQPLLYQVATAGLVPQDVGHPIRTIVRRGRNVRALRAAVTGIDLGARTVATDRAGHLVYDDLILAVGAVTADFGVPGVAEHAYPLKSIGDAVHLRDQILERFEEVALDPSAIGRGALTFVIAGGGPTGVELAGALAELVRHVAQRDYPEIDMGLARIVLVEQQPRLLGAFTDDSADYAARRLERMGVEVRTGITITEVAADAVVFGHGERLPTRTVVWAAGVRAHPLAAQLGLAIGRGGRLVVGEDLRVPGHHEVLAVGDVAAVPDGAGGVLPQLAPVAIQQGRHAAEEVLRSLDGEAPRPFRYTDKGTMATIGRHAAVAELPGRVRFRGLPAWVAWLALHLAYLAGFRNRASVLLHWAWSYLTYDRGARIVFERPGAPAAAPPPVATVGSDTSTTPSGPRSDAA